jgi:hypothetical protein
MVLVIITWASKTVAARTQKANRNTPWLLRIRFLLHAQCRTPTKIRCKSSGKRVLFETFQTTTAEVYSGSKSVVKQKYQFPGVEKDGSR